MKETSKLFCDICTYDDIDYEANLTLIRKKFRFLMNRIVFRKSDDYEYINTHTIPIEDEAIVKKLLIMAIKGSGEDKTCKKWFNGSLALNKYKERANLFCKLEDFLQSLLQKDKINENTYHKWYAIIDTSLYGNTSKQILKIYSNLDSLVETSVGMNNYVDLSSLFTQNCDGSLRRLFAKPCAEGDTISIGNKLCDIIRSNNCQEDYIRSLNTIIEYMIDDSYDRTCSLIESFAPEILQHKSVDANMKKTNLAFEGYGLLNQIYVFLEKNPEALKQISDYTYLNEDEILRYFKFINRDKS